MKRFAVLAVVLALVGCGPRQPVVYEEDLTTKLIRLQSELHATLISEHPKLKKSDVAECQAQSAGTPGGYNARTNVLSSCLTARDLKRQGL